MRNMIRYITTHGILSPYLEKYCAVQMDLKKKLASDGSTTKYKAQLVAKGYSQVHGLDYNERFAHVAGMDSIRLGLSIIASKQWEVHHIDVKSAFLHGDLEEEIYMK